MPKRPNNTAGVYSGVLIGIVWVGKWGICQMRERVYAGLVDASVLVGI